MFRLFCTEYSSSKANEKESICIEPRSRDSSSAIQNRFVTLTLTHEDVRACKLHLPSQFMRANGINKLGKITLLGENKMEWLGYLLTRDGTVVLEIGWDGFCKANGVKLGESFTLEFISEQDQTSPVLKFCSRETKYGSCLDDENNLESESDEEGSQDKRISHECLRRKDKKGSSIWKASSSPSQNRFVTLTLKPYYVRDSKLYLLMRFTKNGINEETKMNMLDKHGVKWSTKLRTEKTFKRIRLLGGWKDFFKANCVQTGESVMLKLIWEEDTSCVLKFCSKVKLETI